MTYMDNFDYICLLLLFIFVVYMSNKKSSFKSQEIYQQVKKILEKETSCKELMHKLKDYNITIDDCYLLRKAHANGTLSLSKVEEIIS